LVFMGACHSGIADGSPMPGDDLFGLQRAFLHQGARTVVSSLWVVEDSVSLIITEEMMKRMNEGVPAARAMVESQREYLNFLRQQAVEVGGVQNWRRLHPKFWAVYTVIGDDRTGFADRR